jgi:hypothetical protein
MANVRDATEMPRSDSGASATPARSGPWSEDPVHEAKVAAKLAGLQARLASAAQVAGPVGAGAVTRRGVVQRLRVRIGHMLVAFGGFIEGRGDCADSTAARTA